MKTKTGVRTTYPPDLGTNGGLGGLTLPVSPREKNEDISSNTSGATGETNPLNPPSDTENGRLVQSNPPNDTNDDKVAFFKCSCCGNTDWWTRPGSDEVVCSICDPQPPMEVIE